MQICSLLKERGRVYKDAYDNLIKNYKVKRVVKMK